MRSLLGVPRQYMQGNISTALRLMQQNIRMPPPCLIHLRVPSKRLVSAPKQVSHHAPLLLPTYDQWRRLIVRDFTSRIPVEELVPAFIHTVIRATTD